MKIAEGTLVAQADRALTLWPFIPALEVEYKLPAHLLLAVGSRETNLDPAYTSGKTGDGGHGHGVWQRDDRSHIRDWATYDLDAKLQATEAAQLLAVNIKLLGLAGGIAAYNGGQGGVKTSLVDGRGVDGNTAGRDYSADVLERVACLTKHYSPKAGPTPVPTQPKAIVKVRDLKRVLTVRYPVYNRYSPTGFLGKKTEAGVKEFQRRKGLPITGVVDARTRKALGL